MSPSTLARPSALEPHELAKDATPRVTLSDDLRPRGYRTVREGRLRIEGLIAAVGFAVFAGVLRLIGVTSSYDLFIDEATYAAIARDTTLLTGPLLDGQPFVLHPPLALLLLAGPADWLGTSNVAELVMGLRPVVALAGALTASIVFLTLYRSGLRVAAYVAALLVALDPFIISFDSRVMLEAFAQLFAVTTIACAIRTLSAAGRSRWIWAAMTAVAGAATFGSKETFGLVILATLCLVALSTARKDRLFLFLAVAGTLIGYALLNLVMIDWSDFSLWWHMRTDGLSRLLGLQHPTGFKAEGVNVSLWDQIAPNAAELASTYAILAIGGLCALSLLWPIIRRTTATAGLSPSAVSAIRVISIWAVCACSYLAYAVLFGSLEEQMFYIAVVPSAASLAIRAALISRRRRRRVAAGGVALILLLQGSAWVQVHTTQNDVYVQMLKEIPGIVPVGSTLSVTEETGQFVITGYDMGQWVTETDLRANGVDYVLISDRLVSHGYGLADQDFADDVRQNGSRVLNVKGRESDLQLYDVRDWMRIAPSPAYAGEDGS